MIGVAFSPVTGADVVDFPQLVATGETICVRGAPGWTFYAVDVAGIGDVASPVLA